MIVAVVEESDGGTGKAYVLDTEKLPPKMRWYAKALEAGPGFIQSSYEDSIRFGVHDTKGAMVELPATVERVHVVWVE